MRSPLTDAEIEARRLRRNEAQRAYRQRNIHKLRERARNAYHARKERIKADMIVAWVDRYTGDDSNLLLKALSASRRLPPRSSAIVDHIKRTVLDGKPFRGWQDDLRDALGIAA